MRIQARFLLAPSTAHAALKVRRETLGDRRSNIASIVLQPPRDAKREMAAFF
jgi:hypothetical protein